MIKFQLGIFRAHRTWTLCILKLFEMYLNFFFEFSINVFVPRIGVHVKRVRAGEYQCQVSLVRRSMPAVCSLLECCTVGGICRRPLLQTATERKNPASRFHTFIPFTDFDSLQLQKQISRTRNSS